MVLQTENRAKPGPFFSKNFETISNFFWGIFAVLKVSSLLCSLACAGPSPSGLKKKERGELGEKRDKRKRDKRKKKSSRPKVTTKSPSKSDGQINPGFFFQKRRKKKKDLPHTNATPCSHQHGINCRSKDARLPSPAELMATRNECNCNNTCFAWSAGPVWNMRVQMSANARARSIP